MKRPSKKLSKRKRNPLTEDDEDKLYTVLALIERDIRFNKEAKYPNEVQLILFEALKKKYKNSENLEEMYDDLHEINQFLERLMNILK